MRKFVLGALSFAAMAFASPASAAIYLFELLGDHEASFLLDSSPSPLPGDVFDGSFGLRDVAAELEGSPVQLFGLVFYASSGEGGFDLYLPTGDVAELAGPQLYTGDDSAPTFLLGTFELVQRGNDAIHQLTISDTAAVPEPAAWVLMIGGFGLAGSVVRRRRERLTCEARTPPAAG